MSNNSFVQKLDIKVGNPSVVRMNIENHLENLFNNLNAMVSLKGPSSWNDDFRYAVNVVSFLISVGVLGRREAKRYYEKLEDLMRERIVWNL